MIKCSFEDGAQTSLRHVVVHGIVENNNKLLLVKRTGPILETGKWSLPSGFMDRNETVEECIVREIKEETGWDSEVQKLFKINSKPNRPHEDRQNVAFEFIVKPIQKTGFPDSESSQIEWVAFDKLIPFEEFAFDHGETIRLFLEYKKNQFEIPILI